MAKNTCKLCSRRFASPRALAGHMRAHSIAGAKSQISSASSASTSVVAGGDDAKKPVVQGYVLREKPKRRVRLAESDFSDRESETTSGFFSPSSPSAKRGHGHGHAGSGDAEPVSSVSDGATPEEDVARSLMMLSRDSWPSPPPPSYRRVDSDDDPRPPIAQKRTRYECPACKKVFRSYQALGGHRASNVRGGKGGCCAPPPPLYTPPPSPMQQPLPAACHGGEGGASWKPQPHQCPHCFRVFSSGQALGGHRRSHLCSAPRPVAADAPVAVPSVTMKSLGFIDLNLPPSFDDVEISAVSNPFLSSKPAS
jgi:hypothetical protein